MPTVKIVRPKEKFNEDLIYKIIVDDVIIGRIKNGEEKTLTFNKNGKTLLAEMNSGKSNKIEIGHLKNDQIVEITGNEFMSKYLPYYGPALSFSALIFLLDHKYENIQMFGKVFFSLGVLIAIYVLIFRRKKWLKLKIVN
ncbi:hypothetical protein [Gillisia marina]|uniref:hypothetical protein n=1 Tax=Gillisia marina TaxID=1167637 RepID=UPI00029A162C|nr:hypothetical protein [Gillisia marina]